MDKAAKAESRSSVTSQPPRKAASTQQRLGKTQRLTAGVGWEAILPKQGRWWVLELISWTEGSIQNWIVPPCWGRSWQNRTVAERQCSCCLLKTTALTTLHKLAVLPHLKIPTHLVDWRNQILLTSQSADETTSELLLVCQYQERTPME
jgi:hypothetical protein